MRVVILEVVSGWCLKCGKESNFIPEEDNYVCDTCRNRKNKKRRKKASKRPRSLHEIYMAVLRGERLKGREFYIFHRYHDNKHNRKVFAKILLSTKSPIEKGRKFLGHPKIRWDKISQAARSK